MTYEVISHMDRREFEEYLQHLKPNQRLHSFSWEPPYVLAVYVTVKAQ